MTPQENILVDQETEQMLKKGAIKVVQQDSSFPQLNICSAPSSPSDKFEKSQSLHSVLLFQNGRVIPLERNITGRGLHVQNRPQGCIFFSPTKFKIPKVFNFQICSTSSFASAVVWDQPQGYSQSWREFPFSVEKTVCKTDYFSGRYTADGFVEGRAGTCKGHSDISSSESGFFDKSQKISTRTMSEYTIFGYGSQLNKNDTDPSPRERREDCGDLMWKSSASIRELSQLIGRLASITIAVLPAPLKYRRIPSRCSQHGSRFPFASSETQANGSWITKFFKQHARDGSFHT